MNQLPPSWDEIAWDSDESEAPHLRQGLQAAYLGVGPTGDKWIDPSGYGNNGTLTNMDPATDWVPSPYGWALDFDGSDDYVVSGTISELSSPSSFTVTIVSYAAELLANRVGISLVNGTSLTDALLIYPFDSGSGGTRAYWGGNLISDSDGLSGVWKTVTFVSRSATDHELYLNAKSIGTSSSSKNLPATTQVNIGRWSSQYFLGLISTVLVHNRALQPTEIQQLYVDPYAPFRRRLFDPALFAGGGLSTVSVDRVILANVLAAVASDRQIIAHVRGLVESDRQILASILQAIQSDRQAIYNVLSSVTSDRQIIHHVFQSITSDRQIIHHLFNLVQSDRTIAANVAQLVNLDRQVAFNVLTKASLDRVIRYNLQSLVQSDRQIIYDVLANAPDVIFSVDIKNPDPPFSSLVARKQ